MNRDTHSKLCGKLVRMDDQSAEPAKPRLLITVAVVGLVVLIWSLVALANDSDDAAPASEEGGAVKVTYEVEGDTRTADITIETRTGTTQSSVDVPLMNRSGGTGISFVTTSGEFVYIAAQNTDDESYGPITCRITTNGSVISENTATGQYAIATCKAAAA